MEAKPIRRDTIEIFIILFLPNLSESLPKRTVASMEKKIPENMIIPTWSNPILNSSASTGIIGAIDALAIPRMKLSLKKDNIIFDFSSLFKLAYPEL